MLVLLYFLTSKTEIQFNVKTLQAFEKEKLEPCNAMLAQKAMFDKFKSKFKEDQYPLQIIINSMHRRSIITVDDKGKAVK